MVLVIAPGGYPSPGRYPGQQVASPGPGVVGGGRARLTRLWLNALDDPGDAVAVPMGRGSSLGWPNLGEVRQYGGGNQLAVTAEGVAQTWSPRLRPVPHAVGVSLIQRAGRDHMARDPLGQRIACTWFGPTMEYVGDGGTGELVVVSLTLELVSFDEAV